MSNDRDTEYLWDGSGTPDGETQKLEALLAPMAPQTPRVPVPRHRRLAAFLLALSTLAFVFFSLPAREVPSRIAALFHEDFPGEIGVRGGSRIEYTLAGEDVGLARTNQVADQLRARGANVVFVKPGSVVIEAVGVEPSAARAWSYKIGAAGALELTMVEHNHPLMTRIFNAVQAELGDTELGVSARVDMWRNERQAKPQIDYYLEAPDALALHLYLDGLAHSDPTLDPGPDLKFVFEKVPGPRGTDTYVTRSYLIRKAAALTQEDVDGATVVFNPITNKPEVLVELTEEGTRSFAELTRQNIGRKLAIMVDGAVQSAPIIQSEIGGGQLTITLGSIDARTAQADAHRLTDAFRAGSMTAPLSLSSVTKVEPVLSSSTATAARALFALPFALFTFLLAWLVGRWAPRINPEVFRLRSRERNESSVLAPLLVTAGAAVAAALCVLVPLPGLNSEQLMNLQAPLNIGAKPTAPTLFAFGLRPLFLAFILVELVALIIPPWQRLRISGPAGRASLGKATALLTLALASLQAWYFTESYFGLDALSNVGASVLADTPWPRAQMIASLVGGTLLLIVLAALVNRRGIGNGYLVVILGGMAYELYRLVVSSVAFGLSASSIGWLVAFTVSVAALTSFVLRIRIPAADGRPRLHLPTCGYIPLAWTVGIVALEDLMGVDVSIAGWFLHADGALNPGLFIGTTAALALVFSLLFSRPTRFRNTMTVVSPRPSSRYRDRAFWVATLGSTVALSAVAALFLLGLEKIPLAATDIIGIALATAAIMDLIASIRAHYRNPTLVPVWPLHRVQLTDLAVDALQNLGIDAHTQGLYVRKLFHFFAPFVPVLIMVPEDKAADAREALGALLGDAAPASQRAL